MKATLINLRPLDVGFDLRVTGAEVKLPDFDFLEVRYMDGQNPVSFCGWTSAAAAKLSAAGYNISPIMMAPQVVDCPEYPGEHEDWLARYIN